MAIAQDVSAINSQLNERRFWLDQNGFDDLTVGMTKKADFSGIFLLIPNPGHDEVGESCKEAIRDNCNDIDHFDSLPACTRYGTIFRSESMSKRDAR